MGHPLEVMFLYDLFLACIGMAVSLGLHAEEVAPSLCTVCYQITTSADQCTLDTCHFQESQKITQIGVAHSGCQWLRQHLLMPFPVISGTPMSMKVATSLDLVIYQAQMMGWHSLLAAVPNRRARRQQSFCTVSSHRKERLACSGTCETWTGAII